MKKYTINFINRNSHKVVESHRTNDIDKCLKRIKRYDESGAMYIKYWECYTQIIDNETGKEVKKHE